MLSIILTREELELYILKDQLIAKYANEEKELKQEKQHLQSRGSKLLQKQKEGH